MFPTEQPTPQPLEYDNSLLEKAAREVKGLHKPKLEFSGESTPKVLFHGFGTSKRAIQMFQNNILNPNGELLWFTNTPQRAASAYGMKIEGEAKEDLAKAGLVHHQKEGHEDWYKANQIKEDLGYLLVLFPHESGNLGSWIVDKTAPTVYGNSQEYITQQNLPLNECLIVRLDKLRSFLREIELVNLSSSLSITY